MPNTRGQYRGNGQPSQASGGDGPRPSLPELMRNLTRAWFESGRFASNLLDDAGKARPEDGFSESVDAGELMASLAGAWMRDPSPLIEAQTQLMASYASLWSHALSRLIGDAVEPVAKADPNDARFEDAEWTANPYFDLWKQFYLVNTRYAEELLERTEDLEPRVRRALGYRLRLLTAALSPSNFPLTSPQIMRETLETNGKNLVNGMRNLVCDMEKPGEVFNVTQTDTEAFEIGRNLATTQGKVVFQNELFQLIQYAPETEKVREVPLLVVPPWINKYYIFDLSPEKSFIRYAVGQGFSVFLMSWVNPDGALSDKRFEDYVTEGLFAAANAVTRETGVARPNVLGYCIGGTMVASGLAYLAARDEDRFRSATLLTTQLDFSNAGDLALFTGDSELAALDELLAEHGTLDGSRMASAFNSLRPKDLIWPYVVNNYLLGKEPPPFDLLYWNQDSTRMPAANHAFYLRQFYNENRLARGEMRFEAPETAALAAETAALAAEDQIVRYLNRLPGRNGPAAGFGTAEDGVRLDLSAVRVPVYELAAREDHIAPAASVYRGARLLGGDVAFVLAGSGHIAGVINPPAKQKYQYWTSAADDAASLDDWFAVAQEHKGSWWPHWAAWLGQHSGGWTAARSPGSRLGVIEDAPGSYVKAA